MKQALANLAEVAGNLDDWMRQEAWPLWWGAGRHGNGSFYEALDFTGRPVPARIARVRVQARQIYSFALARSLGWRMDSLEDKLDQSVDRFFKTCLGPEGIPGTLVDIESGLMTDPQPNLYVTAFTLLALTQCREVLDGPAMDLRIEQILDNIDRHLAHRDGNGYREFLPPDPLRHQNPHMHFYESLLCLYDSTRDPGVKERADTLLDFVRETFFDDANGIVLERVDADSGTAEQQYEPGHSMEWIWLLGYRSRLFGVPLDPFASRLYEKYRSSGIPAGQTPMCLAVDHTPVDPTRRLWSQTEALKAHLCFAEHGPAGLTERALTRATTTARSILDHWLDTECRGGFYDHFDADGNLIAENIPGSMGYHLYVAIAETSRLVRDLQD